MNIEESKGKTVSIGALGGIIGGAAMIPFILLLNTMMGNPAPAFFMKVGMWLGQSGQGAIGTGVGMHLLSALIIGIIFGAVTMIPRLKLTSYKKGTI